MPGKRILLVDYDPRSLTHTREVLEGAGFDVSTCGDGLTALDQFKTLAPDLVLLSAMLPKMHGFEVCSNIRKLPGGEKTPVVIITDVYKGKRYRVDAINKYGATEYIEKPIEDSNLVGILRGLIKDNGSGVPSVEDGDRTVQFSRDVLTRLVKEEVTGATKPSGEKKTVSDKPKKDDISRKLEQSLAGLDLEIGKRPKPKPKPEIPVDTGKAPAQAASDDAPPTVVLQKDTAGAIFTSEDLFTDVIASVERELQSEKLADQPVADKPREEPTVMLEMPKATPAPPAPDPAPTVPEPPVAAPVPEAVMAAPAAEPPRIQEPPPKVEPKPAPPAVAKAAEPVRKGSDDFDKKLSSTLSGLVRDKGKVESSAAKVSPAAKPAEVPRAQVPTVKPKAPEIPKPAASVETPAPVPRPEPKPAPPAKPKPEPRPAAAKHAPKEAEQEGINFGNYLLLGKIATGGMAELFKAKRKGVEGFEKILAIKRILPHMSDNEEFVTMFIDEAKLAAQLTHHNICQIFDLGKIENSYYIAMEFVHGKDLRAVLKASRTKSKAMPVDLAVMIISKICSALDYAHRKKGTNGQPLNLVHRDVSPQNILISYEGEVKLVDFGIAKAATKVHVTQHGALKGKLLYMSPEQAWGRPVDKRADIFSLGTVLYELLTGRPLFFDENDTEVTILEKVREAKVTPIREFNSRVPQELEKIVAKALKKGADERYQTAMEMQKELDSLFYSESYNTTSGSLADFVRDLFPEEWAQETGVKESVSGEKAASPAPGVEEQKTPAPPSRKPKKQEPAPPSRAAKSEPAPAPEKKPEPAPVPVPAEKPAAAAFRDISVPDIMAPPEKSSFPIVPVGIGVAVLVFIIAYFLFRSKPEEPVAAQPPATQTATPPPVEQPTTPGEQASPAVPVETKPPEDQTAADKQAQLKKAEEEKKKEEERKKQELAKLEEEQKKTQEQAKAEPAATTPPPVEETKVAETQAPPPVQEEPKPEPPPVVTEAPKEVPKEEPKPVAPAGPVVNEGDLVELTPDVAKPEVVNKKNPNYPPAAQKQKVEGTVIVSILVSETGKVADVKVLRGIGGSSGLNEAAVAAVKSWTFRPAVKAGKRVKVWVTYPIVFKIQN